MKSGWAIKKLGELGTIVRGKGIRRNETVDRGLPCIRYGEIYTSYNYILDCPHSFVSKDVFARCPKIKEGDVVFTLTGENKDEIAKALAYLGKDEIAAGGDLAIWSKHGCDPKFLAYMMYAPKLIEAKARASNGDIIVHASVKKMQEIDIPLPPLSEQKRIVAKIDAALEKIDKLKANAEKNLANAKELFQSALDEAMRPKDGWVEKRLGEVANIRVGPFGSSLHKADYVENGVPLVNPCHMKDSKIADKISTQVSHNKAESLKEYRLRAGDIVFARRGEIGRLAFVSEKEDGYLCGTGSLFARFRERFDIQFLYFFFSSKSFVERLEMLSTGTTMKSINSSALESMSFSVPPMNEQQQLAQQFDSLAEKIKILEQNYSKQIADCVEMRQAVLREAFEGRL